MAGNHFLEDAPPMWWIERSKGDASVDGLLAGRLFLGDQCCYLADVAGYDITQHETRDNDGLILAGIGFFFISALILNAIVMFGWPWKFWIGVGFCGFFALVSLLEAMTIMPVIHYELEVELVDGSLLSFSTADCSDLSNLVSVLDEMVELNEHGRDEVWAA